MTTPNPADLGVIVTSAKLRKQIYGAYVLLLLLAGATQVGFAAVSAGQPQWLVAVLAVLAYLGIPVGGLAAANTAVPVKAV